MPRHSPGGQNGDRRACRQVDIAHVADSLRALAAPSYAPHIESSTQRVDNHPEREERNQMASSGPDKGIAKIAKIAKVEGEDTEGHIAKIAKATPIGERDIARVDPPTEDR